MFASSSDQFCSLILDSSSIQDKINRYENFVEDVLKDDLARIGKRHENICEIIAEYMNIKSIIKTIKDKDIQTLKTMSDIGSNCYVKCVVPKTDHILMNIGLDCFVEFTIDEALNYIEQIVEIHNKTLEILVENSAKIKSHIKIVLNLIDQLKNNES